MDSEAGACKKYLFLIALLVLLLFVPSASESQEFEYKLKAEFIERFTRFIEWPASALAQDSFEICIAGKNPFGNYLSQITSELKIKERVTRLTEIGNGSIPSTCNVLFISNSAETSLPRIVEALADKPVLTIADTEGFAEKGVLINFYRSDSYVRFEINVSAAHRSGLKFSSRLLKLARLIDTPEAAMQGVSPP